MDLYDELSQVVRVFADNELDYAICGGIAVAFHGYERFTRDIDVLIRPDDLGRAHHLLEQVGFLDPSGRIPFKHHDLYRITKIDGSEFLMIDLLVVNAALAEAWESRHVYNWSGTEIRVVSKEGLALMKRLAGREKDLLDLKQLGFEDECTEE